MCDSRELRMSGTGTPWRIYKLSVTVFAIAGLIIVALSYVRFGMNIMEIWEVNLNVCIFSLVAIEITIIVILGLELAFWRRTPGYNLANIARRIEGRKTWKATLSRVSEIADWHLLDAFLGDEWRVSTDTIIKILRKIENGTESLNASDIPEWGQLDELHITEWRLVNARNGREWRLWKASKGWKWRETFNSKEVVNMIQDLERHKRPRDSYTPTSVQTPSWYSKPPHEIYHRNDATYQTSDEIDISALLDPVAYFGALDYIEAEILEKCAERQYYPDGFGSIAQQEEEQTPGESRSNQSSNILGRGKEKSGGNETDGEAGYHATTPIFRDTPVDRQSAFRAGTRSTAAVESIKDGQRVLSELRAALSSLVIMQNNGICNDRISVFVEVEGSPNILEVVDLMIADVEQLVNLTTDTQRRTKRHLSKQTSLLLAKFGVSRVVQTVSEHEDDLDFLGVLLTLSIMSFVGSHCINTTFDTTELLHFSQFKATDDKRQNFSFRQRKLACLDPYVGSKVWAFGRSENIDEPASLMVTIPQLALLWGPVFVVPTDPTFEEVLALNIDGGILHRVPKPMLPLSTTSSTPEDRVWMHFLPSGPVRTSLTRREVSHSKLVAMSTNEKLPNEFLPFPSTATMIIGRGPGTDDDSYIGRGLPPMQLTTNRATGNVDLTVASPGLAQLRQEVGLDKFDPDLGLSHNESCSTGLASFGMDHALDIHVLGTQDSCYLPETYQANFGGGQWVNLGIQKSWKRRPASTYKTMLLEYCSKPRTQKNIKAILDRRVGLEWSACTGNARRITLWEAVKLAFPGDLTTLQDAYVAGDGAVLSEFVADFESTGMDEQGRLRLFWPLSEGLPQVLELSKDIPTWSKILKDSRESACFAVISDCCLESEATDRVTGLGGTTVASLCSSKPCAVPRQQMLGTVINLPNEYQKDCQIGLRQKLRLEAGELEIRDLSGEGKLAKFSLSFGLRGRLSIGGHARPVCRELLHESNVSRSTLAVRIVDR